jgi:hypothetical protein
MALPDQLRQVLHDTTPLSFFGGSSALAANNTILSSGTLDPAPDSSGPAQRVQLELTCTFATAPTANSPIDVYFVYTIESGATPNYEDASTGSPGVTPQTPVWTFTVRGVATAQRRVSPPLQLPPLPCRILVHNRANQSMNAGWNIRAIRISDQVVE